MQWSQEQRKLTEKYRSLQEIPPGERRYKCFTCHTIVDSTPCPKCGETRLQVLCPLDHCQCSHEILARIEYLSPLRKPRLPGLRVPRRGADQPGHRLPPGRLGLECRETAGTEGPGALPALMRYFFEGRTLFLRGNFRAASTGVDGGLRKVTTILNHTVDGAFDHEEPLRSLEEISAGKGFSRDFFGLLTAVPIRTTCILQYNFITLFVTAGVTHPNPASAGTINIIVHSAEGFTDGALLETILTSTMAKADALRALGHSFSGTVTDAVVAACEGPVCHTYAGTSTEAGRRIYRAAFHGVQEALARHEGRVERKAPSLFIFSRYGGITGWNGLPRDAPIIPAISRGSGATTAIAHCTRAWIPGSASGWRARTGGESGTAAGAPSSIPRRSRST